MLNLDFVNLPIIVNGTDGNTAASRHFDAHCAKEKILWSWAKIGFVPFTTRSCLNNKRIRKELGQRREDVAVLENLQVEYEVLNDSL